MRGLGFVARWTVGLGRFQVGRVLCSKAGLGAVTVSAGTMGEVEGILGYRFRDRGLLVRAMTHRSLINAGEITEVQYENGEGLSVIRENNERLEWLGDRVFGLLAVQLLYDKEYHSEGPLTKVAHQIVSRNNAHYYCRRLTLDRFLLETDVLKGRKGARYGDFFEALLGALFLDGGYDAAEAFFRTRVEPLIDVSNLCAYNCNKMALQEYLVSRGLPGNALGTQMKYVGLRADFEAQAFTQAIQLFGRTVCKATASTKAAADQDAAQRLLNNLKKVNATCFLIRLARHADDKDSLAKLQAARRMQVNDCTAS